VGCQKSAWPVSCSDDTRPCRVRADANNCGATPPSHPATAAQHDRLREPATRVTGACACWLPDSPGDDGEAQ
jgi:hypothetical protein